VVITSENPEDGPAPLEFVAKTEKAYPAQVEGQVTVIGDADPAAEMPVGLE
jgi:hypothetical protein